MTSAPPSDDPASGNPATEPIPVIHRRPSWRESFGVLGIYNYRLYAFSQVFANTGIWMARVAIGWLMLELTGVSVARSAGRAGRHSSPRWSARADCAGRSASTR